MLEPRIGEAGGKEPLICAFSGQKVAGRHSVHYALGNGKFYYAVLAKFDAQWQAVRATKEPELLALVPIAPAEKPTNKKKAEE